jgi:hypothetical protein
MSIDVWNHVWIPAGLRVADLGVDISHEFQGTKVSTLLGLQVEWN